VVERPASAPEVANRSLEARSAAGCSSYDD
jgi:hypothetical protein